MDNSNDKSMNNRQEENFMNIQIEPILIEQKSVLIQLLNLYCYDFTEYSNEDINEYGYYVDDDIKYYTENLGINPKMHPFFILFDGKLAGFVIAGVGSYLLYLDDENAYVIENFFIMKKYRRNGIGSFVAKAIFDMFKGKWEVCQKQNNLPARKFWKSVISEYTGNNYQECGTENDEMVGFIFDNSHAK